MQNPGPTARRYTDSSSFKMAAIFTLFLGVSAGALSFLINQFNTDTLIDRVDVMITSDWRAFQDWREHSPLYPISEVIDRMRDSHLSYLSYQNPTGEYEYGSIDPDGAEIMMLDDDILLMRLSKEHLLFHTNFEGSRRFAARYYDLQDGGRILIARDVENGLFQRTRMQQLGLLVIVMMLLVIAFSFYISTYVAGLTSNISNTANEIMETGDFSQRIPVDRGGDDLSDLANVLNDLLANTENLMQSVRQVSDNIAHDLRTPLSRLRNQLEELDEHVGKSGDTESQKITESVIREADHILGTFGALLRIARIESGKKEQDFSVVDMEEILRDVLELYEPLAEEKGIKVNTSLRSAKSRGDADMLFQMFGNLVDNAIKFTDEGGLIEVSCQPKSGCVEVVFSDNGCGIPDKDKPKIFNRFYRAEESRTTSGNGLGLSLVQAVMTLHKAVIKIKDNSPGTRFEIHLKAA